MKTYVGERSIDGVVVTVSGQPLDPAVEQARYSSNGFEWTYEGAEPKQLAFALLFDHLADTAMAEKLTPRFMTEVVANFDNDWTMTSQDIAAAVEAIAASPLS
jgi:hypothetical protein